MEISWINILSPWSLIFFITIYAIGYFFIEIIWGESYIYKKQLNEWNHISIKWLHYIFWGFPISILFLYLFLTKWDLNSLNQVLKSISDLVIYFSPDKQINWSAFWLILSIEYFYIVVIFLTLFKFIFKLPYKLEKIYFDNKDFFDTKWLFFLWIIITLGWLIFYIISHFLWFKDFLQNNYIYQYLYIIERFVYYSLVLIPMSFYFILKKLWFKNKKILTLWIAFIILSLYLFFASIYWVKFDFINSIINYVFNWDLLGFASSIVYYAIIIITLVWFWYLWYFILRKSSDNIPNKELMDYLFKSYEAKEKIESLNKKT